jgi:hypothetical protein
MTTIILWLLLGLLLGVGSHRHVRRNYGGWSAARALGATRVKALVSRAIGVPLTASGRLPQVGRNDLQVVRLLINVAS